MLATTRSATSAVLTGSVLLILTAPRPSVALQQLSDPSAAAPTDLLVAVIALVSCVLVAWLALTVLLTAGGRLPGAAGAAARSVVRLVAPATVRRAVELALGLSLATGALGAGPAAAAPPIVGSSTELVTAPSATRPSAAALGVGRPAGTPAAAERAAATAAAGAGGAAPSDSVERAVAADLDWPGLSADPPEPVVVRLGDTLWGLAEQALHESAGAPPSTAQVAQAWPRWWSANRQVIGDDPDLLLPGMALTPPQPQSLP